MTRDEKKELATALAEKFSQTNCFYVVNAEGMNAAQVAEFRARCFEKGLIYQVAKNTLIEKALKSLAPEYGNTTPLLSLLKGASGLLFALPEAHSVPATVIERFRKDKGIQKPLLKGAWIDGECISGDSSLSALSKLKSKAQVLGELLAVLEAPFRNLTSALTSGKHNLNAVMQALIASKGT